MQVMTRAEYEEKFGKAPVPASGQVNSQHGRQTPIYEKVSNFLGGKGVTDYLGAKIAKSRLPKEQRQFVEEPTKKQVLGSAMQLGALAIPGAGVGANSATKMAVGAGTGYALDVGSKLQQQDENPLKPGIGTAVGASLPIGGAALGVGKRIVGRLFKGLGSGLSGVPSKTIDTIMENPRAAQEASRRIEKAGASKVLEDNAKTIVNGVSTIRQEARKAYGEGLEQLAKQDINPTTFRQATQKFLDKYGVAEGAKRRVLSNVEFDDPKNIKKASELISRLSKTELDGKSLRKLADDIDNAVYKTATSDERLAFNAFLKDLSGTLKSAVNSSTDKLKQINAKFTQDMELTQGIQQIFGKVKFKNLPEVLRASQKLEGLFSQKGLAPEVVDDFLNRIGIDAGEFKAGEAIRQIGQVETTGNAKGLNFGEVARGITSSVITPEMVGTIARLTGLAQQEISPILQKMKPTARNLFIDALLSSERSQK